jgi:cytosine/adenosine deaminase-related metal-dependent hydrolase
MQRLRGVDGVPLTSTHLRCLPATAGAAALGLDGQVGDLSVGMRLDALWLRPPAGSPLDFGLRHAERSGGGAGAGVRARRQLRRGRRLGRRRAHQA